MLQVHAIHGNVSIKLSRPCDAYIRSVKKAIVDCNNGMFDTKWLSELMINRLACGLSSIITFCHERGSSPRNFHAWHSQESKSFNTHLISLTLFFFFEPAQRLKQRLIAHFEIRANYSNMALWLYTNRKHWYWDVIFSDCHCTHQLA